MCIRDSAGTLENLAQTLDRHPLPAFAPALSIVEFSISQSGVPLCRTFHSKDFSFILNESRQRMLFLNIQTPIEQTTGSLATSWLEFG